MLIWLIKSAEKRGPEPGRSANLLPAAGLPGDLGWAAGNAAIAEAFARGSAAVEAAGRRSARTGSGRWCWPPWRTGTAGPGG